MIGNKLYALDKDRKYKGNFWFPDTFKIKYRIYRPADNILDKSNMTAIHPSFSV